MKEIWPTLENLEKRVKMMEGLNVSIQLAIYDLSNRVRQLEQVLGMADREMPIPCPWCIEIDKQLINWA